MLSTFKDDFLAGLAARRGAKPGVGIGSNPAPTAAAEPPASRAASWASIADAVNAEAGLKRGANITPAAANRAPGLARPAPSKSGAADWADVAAKVNAEAGLSPHPTTGANR